MNLALGPQPLRGATLAGIACGLLLAAAATAQDPGWVLQGEGGLIAPRSFSSRHRPRFCSQPPRVASPRRATAAGSGRRCIRGFDGRSVPSLAIDPRRPQRLFATTDTGGVFKSVAGGDHWAPANTRWTAPYIGTVAVDPHSSATVYAGSESGRLFKSTNGGDSWSESSPPLARVCAVRPGGTPATPVKICEQILDGP